MSLSVPYPRWAEFIRPGEISDRLIERGFDEQEAEAIDLVLTNLFLEHAREEEANYEAIIDLIEGN